MDALSLPVAIVMGAGIVAVAIALATLVIVRQSSSNRATGFGSGFGGQPNDLEFPHSKEGHPVPPTNEFLTLDTYLDVGHTVLAFSQDRWWRAEVVALIGDDSVLIHFPGWDPKWDTVVYRTQLQVDDQNRGRRGRPGR